MHGAVRMIFKSRRELNIDKAIDTLAGHWRDDGMCAEKEYYIRKLNQLRDIIERSWLSGKPVGGA